MQRYSPVKTGAKASPTLWEACHNNEREPEFRTNPLFPIRKEW